jgi:hypothetical protein
MHILPRCASTSIPMLYEWSKGPFSLLSFSCRTDPLGNSHGSLSRYIHIIRIAVTIVKHITMVPPSYESVKEIGIVLRETPKVCKSIDAEWTRFYALAQQWYYNKAFYYTAEKVFKKMEESQELVTTVRLSKEIVDLLAACNQREDRMYTKAAKNLAAFSTIGPSYEPVLRATILDGRYLVDAPLVAKGAEQVTTSHKKAASLSASREFRPTGGVSSGSSSSSAPPPPPPPSSSSLASSNAADFM